MSYGANVPGIFRRAATYVDKILKNARALGLTVRSRSCYGRTRSSSDGPSNVSLWAHGDAGCAAGP